MKENGPRISPEIRIPKGATKEQITKYMKDFNRKWFAKEDKPWSVWRQDDNGNKFLVVEKLNEEDARKIASHFEAKGHTQHYWVESSVPASKPDQA